MLILFLMTTSVDSPYGAGRLFPIAQELVKLGHDVQILALHHDWANCEQCELERDGIKIRYVGQMHVLKRGNNKSYWKPLKLLSVAAWATWALWYHAMRVPADVIHVCKPHPMNGLAGIFAARLKGVPVYFDSDDNEMLTSHFTGRWQRPFVRWAEEFLPKLARYVTVPNRYMQHHFEEIGVPDDRIVTLANGTDPSRFAPPPSDMIAELRDRWNIEPSSKVIGYIGTMGFAMHPVDMLLEAFAQLAQKHPDFTLLLVGQGPDFHRIGALVDSLGIREQTRVVGYVPPTEVSNYYALCDVIVDPVRDDEIARARATPYKLLESLASGRPIVTANFEDRCDILGPEFRDWVVPPGEVDALATKLVSVAQRRESEWSVERIRQRAMCYTWANVVRRAQHIYSS